METLAVVSLRYPVRPNPEAWVIPEGPVPESTAHQAAVYRIYGLLTAWARRVSGERSIRLGQELAVRWLEQHPRTGIDPDVCVLEPAPADFDDLTSLRLWEPGRLPPRLAIEVVSASHPYKDYASIQERYAAMGVEELFVFDPLLCGPPSLGGPVALQLWRRDSARWFERVHFGSEPVHSLVLDAWFIAEGRTLHVSDDRNGTRRWLTDSERLLELESRLPR
jgi:Uma2 family endonuclease